MKQLIILSGKKEICCFKLLIVNGLYLGLGMLVERNKKSDDALLC